MSEDIQHLIDKARRYEMTPDEREKQAVDFAYGNAKYENERVTVDGIVRASEALKTAASR